MKHFMRTICRPMCSTLVALTMLVASGFAAASENTAYVKLQLISIYSDGVTQYTYLLSQNGWGFANCTAANNGWLYLNGSNPAAKSWLAQMLTAKAAGQTVSIFVDNCTSLNIIQINVQ